MQNFCMLFNYGRPKLTDSSYDAEFLHFNRDADLTSAICSINNYMYMLKLTDSHKDAEFLHFEQDAEFLHLVQLTIKLKLTDSHYDAEFLHLVKKIS